MENRNLGIWNRGWELTYEFLGWQYSIPLQSGIENVYNDQFITL